MPLLGFIDSDGKFKIRDNVKKSKGKNTGRECETYTAKNILDYIESPLITQKIPMEVSKRKIIFVSINTFDSFKYPKKKQLLLH